MNIIYTLIILTIIIFIINYLTEGKLLNNCKSICEKFIGNDNAKTLPFTGQLDFPYMNYNTNDIFDTDTYNLYNFINSLIAPNINQYELTPSQPQKIMADKKMYSVIVNYIKTSTNSGYFIFDEIKILDNIFYYNNPRGKEIEMCKFSANVSLNNGLRKRFIGNLVFMLDLFIHEDIYKKYDTYTNSSLENNFIAIINIKLLGNISKASNDIPNKKKAINIKKAKDINKKMNDSFNNYFVNRDVYDNLFIKPAEPNIINDTENSLIPSAIDFSQSYNDS